MEPVIKVRHKMSASFLLLAIVVLLSPAASSGKMIQKCEKSPKEMSTPKSEGDHGYALLINGSPRLYRPNQMYTVTLKVRLRWNIHDGIYKFHSPNPYFNFRTLARKPGPSSRASCWLPSPP